MINVIWYFGIGCVENTCQSNQHPASKLKLLKHFPFQNQTNFLPFPHHTFLFLFTVAESRFVFLGRVSCHHVEGPLRDRENQLIALTVVPRCSRQPKLEHETGMFSTKFRLVLSCNVIYLGFWNADVRPTNYCFKTCNVKRKSIFFFQNCVHLIKPSAIDSLFKLKVGTERTSVQQNLQKVKK